MGRQVFTLSLGSLSLKFLGRWVILDDLLAQVYWKLELHVFNVV